MSNKTEVRRRSEENRSMESGEAVQVLESSMVAPIEATPTKRLRLSPIDLAATAGHIPLVFLYTSSGAAAFCDVARLKEAMARALVPFYPLAGRLAVDEHGRLEISCNGEGAFFVVSRSSSLAAADVDFSRPSPLLKRLFVPPVAPSSSLILAVQVTFLKCGGVVLGVAIHHAATDGMGTFHFLQTWSAIARDGAAAAIDLPSHDRAPLRARSPPVVHPAALSVLYLYPKPKAAAAPRAFPPSERRPNAVEVFRISRDQIAALKRRCGGGGATSTFCSVSALVWRCAVIARRLPPDSTARLTFPANIRRRRRLVPARYFGNAVVELCAAGAAGEIAAEPLASVAGRIGGTIARMDEDDDGGDELVRSAVDCLELAGTTTGSSSRRRPLTGGLPETTEIRVNGWLSVPLYVADFGGGGPRWMTRAEAVRGGYVYIMSDGPEEHGGGVRVVVCMEAENIEEFGMLFYASIRKHHESKL